MKKIENEEMNQKTEWQGTVFSLAAVVAFLVELYIVIHMPEEYIALAAIGCILLALVYKVLQTNNQKLDDKEKADVERYENIFKSEKANYILQKNSVEELLTQLENLKEEKNLPIEELIDAQKSIAKVTINRTKENATAIMNSNDKLLELFFKLDDKIGQVEEDIFLRQKEEINRLEESLQKVEAGLQKEFDNRLQEIASKIKETELTINNETLKAINSLPQQPVQVNYHAQSVERKPKVEAQKNILDEMEIPEDLSVPEISDEIEIPEDLSVPEISDEIEIPEDLNMPEISSAQDMDSMDVDEITKLLEGLEVPEDVDVEADTPESLYHEETEHEVVQEPEMLKPVSDDPNHIMTADEIAAMVAQMESQTKSDAPVVEPEPEPQIENIPDEVEVKPPMPDLSDPNHVMTPEEIAALLANM